MVVWEGAPSRSRGRGNRHWHRTCSAPAPMATHTATTNRALSTMVAHRKRLGDTLGAAWWPARRAAPRVPSGVQVALDDPASAGVRAPLGQPLTDVGAGSSDEEVVGSPGPAPGKG